MIWDREWTQEAVLSGWTPTTPATAPHYGENWYLDDNGTGMVVDIWNTIWHRTPLSYHAGTRTLTFPNHTLEHLGPKPGEDVTFQWAGQRVEIDSPTGWQWFTVQSNTHNRLALVEPPDFDPTGRRIRRLCWTLLSGSTPTVLQIEPNWFRERQSVKTSPYRNWAGRTIYISDGTRWHQRTIASNTLQTITLNAALGFSPRREALAYPFREGRRVPLDRSDQRASKRDGKFSREELPGALFDRLDADKDGFVSEKALKALGRNK
jgi:hypothetical protein